VNRPHHHVQPNLERAFSRLSVLVSVHWKKCSFLRRDVAKTQGRSLGAWRTLGVAVVAELAFLVFGNINASRFTDSVSTVVKSQGKDKQRIPSSPLFSLEKFL
jgi:hypothetical protein